MRQARRDASAFTCCATIGRLGPDTAGATAIEYSLIAALIAVGIIGALTAVGDQLVALPMQSIVDAIMGVLS